MKLKNLFKTMVIAGIAAAALLLGSQEARAGAAAQSFNTTNGLASGVNYANYPTNSSGIATGAGIKIENYPSLGFYFDCDVSNNAAAKVWVALVRSHLSSLTASSVTNNSGVTNWETTPVYGCFISIPATTNHFTWMTNLPNDFAGCAQMVGVGALTNNLASGQLVTNLNIGVVKKITPIVYP